MALTRHHQQPGGDSSSDDGECCGMHITCEKDSLLAAVLVNHRVFSDDEELDRFAAVPPPTTALQPKPMSSATLC